MMRSKMLKVRGEFTVEVDPEDFAEYEGELSRSDIADLVRGEMYDSAFANKPWEVRYVPGTANNRTGRRKNR